MTQHQLDLIPRQTSHPSPGVVHLPNWLSLQHQQALLQLLRSYTKNGWYTPLMPNGTPMKHPLACLGYQWRPYEYYEPRRPIPDAILLMAIVALKDAGLDKSLPYTPDTGIVNLFPSGSSLGMHQDKSEDMELIDAGSPIVTISLGDTAVFRLGNCTNTTQPYQDFELRSGDLLVMSGHSRLAYHAVLKILDDTCPPALMMQRPGRISLTLRQAKVPTVQPLQPLQRHDRVWILPLAKRGVVVTAGSMLSPDRILVAPLPEGMVQSFDRSQLKLETPHANPLVYRDTTNADVRAS